MSVQTASLLNLSETWVRRHRKQLPADRIGRLVRFDASLLHKQFEGRKERGNRLETERIVPLRYRRYQEGSVFMLGKRGKQMW